MHGDKFTVHHGDSPWLTVARSAPSCRADETKVLARLVEPYPSALAKRHHVLARGTQ